jgi:hypothetical protein
MRDDSLVLDFGESSISRQLQHIADHLALLSDRTDWWGPARVAFDAIIDNYRVRAHALALETEERGP